MFHFLLSVCLTIVIKFMLANAGSVTDLTHEANSFLEFTSTRKTVLQIRPDKKCVFGVTCQNNIECYPNGTISVTNPNAGTYTNVYAVENEGNSGAVECSCSTSGSESIITGCSQDQPIAVHFSNRASGAADGAFGGSDVQTYLIQCSDIPSLGVDRTVYNDLGATLEVTTQDAVTPSFTISSALRVHTSQEGAIVSGAEVGASIYWTIDVPSDYSARPSCTAYSGNSNSGSPSKTLFTDGCSDDSDLIADADFSAIYTSVPLINRYYVTLYVFQFYNSENVYFECDVKVCPSGSSACDFNCVRRKRSIANSTLAAETEVFKTGQLLHIMGGNSATSNLGSLLLLVGAMVVVLYK